jgi:PKD repeat protein
MEGRQRFRNSSVFILGVPVKERELETTKKESMRQLFTKQLKNLFFVIVLLGMQQNMKAQCTANFTFSYNANGNVQFYSITSPSIGVGHSWSFGNSQNSSQTNPNVTYTANGIYTVCLTMWTPSVAATCSATSCQTINVTNAITPTCVLNASYTQTTSANSATFLSNSTGTVVGSTYTWDYGDMTSFGSGNTTSHIYAGPGWYTCKLIVNNGSGCIDSVMNTVVVNGPCPLNASFTSNQLGNGNVQFVSTSTGTTASTVYQWYKNSNYAGSGDPINLNFINGTYTVMLYATNNSSFCTSTSSQVIVVTSNTCNLVASFAQTVSANSASFASTSTGTTGATTYAWSYGDSNTGTGNPVTHTYANGPANYACYLVVSNGPGCVDSIGNAVNINVPCNLQGNFTINQLGNGNVQFVSTSTGTTTQTSYFWYKNGYNYIGGNNPQTAYFPNGTYTITFVALNSYSPTNCTSTVTQVMTVNSNTCNLAASFSFTQGASGLVNYASTSTGTIVGMIYDWDFGDGNTLMNGGPTTSHTYSNAGIHNVSLAVYDPNNTMCYDSTSNPVNITTLPCIANSNFSMTMITSGYWNATPAYPWNVVNATWAWGDNTSSNQLYTTHTYSPIGVYNICLTVSVSCGNTSTTCTTYTITRMSQPMTMAYINVIPPPQNITTSIKQQTMLTDNNFLVFPNPSNGKFDIRLIGFNENEAVIKVYNLTGVLVYEAKGTIENGNLDHNVRLDHAQGVYFVKIESNSGVITKKIILKD